LPEVERPFPYARVLDDTLHDTLIIRGHNFDSDTTKVMLGKVEIPKAQIAPLKDDRIEVPIPDNALLQPGPQPVKVVLDVMMGEPPEPHLGFQSNVAVFMLVPSIPSPSNLTADLSASPRTLQITGHRLFHPEHESLTLVGDEVIRSSAYTTATQEMIKFNLPDSLGSGSYPVRVRVHGAESIDERTLDIQ